METKSYEDFNSVLRWHKYNIFRCSKHDESSTTTAEAV
jgi:hypothetical protein